MVLFEITYKKNDKEGLLFYPNYLIQSKDDLVDIYSDALTKAFEKAPDTWPVGLRILLNKEGDPDEIISAMLEEASSDKS